MSPDDALRGTLRTFSTLFLVVFAVSGPLHLLYAFAFADVLALRELHPAIENFPPSRQVRGVGLDALRQARVWFWVVTVIELLLLPVFLRVAGHVISLDHEGEVPTATEAWRRLRRPASVAERSGPRNVSTVAFGILTGVAIGLITEATVMVVADLVPDAAAFAAIALARSIGHSAGAAVALGTFILARKPTPAVSKKVPDLY